MDRLGYDFGELIKQGQNLCIDKGFYYESEYLEGLARLTINY